MFAYIPLHSPHQVEQSISLFRQLQRIVPPSKTYWILPDGPGKLVGISGHNESAKASIYFIYRAQYGRSQTGHCFGFQPQQASEIGVADPPVLLHLGF